MSSDYDIIVLGCGTMGAATLAALAGGPSRVLGLDRTAPPHTLGEHHGVVRMFRMSYFEHPAYVPWLRHSKDAWLAMGRGRAPPLIELTGALYLGLPDSELISGSLRSAREHGLAHESLDHAEVRRRYPMLRIPAGFVGLFERDAGFVWCERAVRAMLDRAAAAANVEVHAPEEVLGWSADGGGVEVRTAAARYRARRLVITAGPWSGQLLGDLKIPLTVTRQVQGWMTPADATPFDPACFPCWAIDIGGGALFYGFPALPSGSVTPEIKMARHARGGITTAGTADRTPRPGDAEDFLPLVREYLPGLADAPVRTSVCLYTNSPDGQFLIDRHPAHSNVILACGFSGHGFKLAPAIGQIVLRLVTSETPHHPEPFFALSRLQSGGAGGGSPA